MFVTAVLIQRETGGNLSEILDRIATLMRERAAMKDEIETMTSEAKLSARVVASLPFIVAGAAWLIDSNFMTPLIEASVGPYVILGALSSVLVGYFILMRIADVNV